MNPLHRTVSVRRIVQGIWMILIKSDRTNKIITKLWQPHLDSDLNHYCELVLEADIELTREENR